jgi:hypothetical protein
VKSVKTTHQRVATASLRRINPVPPFSGLRRGEPWRLFRQACRRFILPAKSFSKHEAIGFTMQDDDGKPDGQPGAFAKNSGKGARGDRRQDQRQDRLKLALRENLKRRKSQARGRDDLASASSNTDDISPYDDGIKKPAK